METAIIYTHPPDYAMASLSARALRDAGFRAVVAIDRADPRLVMEGVEVVRTSFDRRGALNGLPFIMGNLELMQREATSDFVFKVDSDTLVLRRPQIFDGRGEAALGIHVHSMDGMQGCCYAIRVDAIESMREEAMISLSPNGVYPEDKFTGRLAEKAGGAFLPKQDGGLTRFASFDPEKSHKWHLENLDVVVFPRRHRGEGVRREITAAMKSFFE